MPSPALEGERIEQLKASIAYFEKRYGWIEEGYDCVPSDFGNPEDYGQYREDLACYKNEKNLLAAAGLSQTAPAGVIRHA